MWVERPIERVTHEQLVSIHGNGEGEQRFGLYTTARKYLIEDILPQIRAVVPDLTDHSPEHVAHVLDNAGKLLNIEAEPEKLSPIELYSLILSILFHDVGNIYGRADHQHKVSEIYDYCRARAGSNPREKSLVLKVTAAHCGTAVDGSNDTIKDIPPLPDTLDGQPVRLQWIAALLRFADELAEGRNRTSQFMQHHHLYHKGSRIYHSYASVTEVAIDPGNSRIALTYDIAVKCSKSGTISTKEEGRVEELIKYIYLRISKLDQERKYAKHYCDLLHPFKFTTIAFNFMIKDQMHGLGLPQQYTLTDLVVPGEGEKQLYEYDEKYKIENIIQSIKDAARG